MILCSAYPQTPRLGSPSTGRAGSIFNHSTAAITQRELPTRNLGVQLPEARRTHAAGPGLAISSPWGTMRRGSYGIFHDTNGTNCNTALHRVEADGSRRVPERERYNAVGDDRLVRPRAEAGFLRYFSNHEEAKTRRKYQAQFGCRVRSSWLRGGFRSPLSLPVQFNTTFALPPGCP
jgi:hypothetical protein